MANNIVPSNFDFLMGTIRTDGLVNITALSTAYRNKTGKRKDCAKWLATSEAIESIAYLERVTQKCVSLLVVVEHGVGTWVHSDLAEIFAQWCSVEYRFAVIDLIRCAKENQVSVVRELPQRDAIDYINASATLATLPDSRLKRLLDARLVAELSIDIVNQQQIAPVEEVKNYTTATVRAAQLGYSAKQIGNGSSLGTFVHQEIDSPFKDWQGQFKVYHYEVSDSLDTRIHAYFLTRSL
jgi:KilA-N domain